MGHETFVIWINESRYIAVDFVTVQGEVVSFVVRLMTCGSDGDRILSRFDTAHGVAHQDLLTAHGNLREKSGPGNSPSTMRSTTSKPITKNTRVKHSFLTLPAAEKARLAKNLTELRQRLKAYGAVPVSPAMKRRLVAAGAWGMPDE